MQKNDAKPTEAGDEQAAYEAPRIAIIGRIEELTMGPKSKIHPDTLSGTS